jgi:hypothetical protein
MAKKDGKPELEEILSLCFAAIGRGAGSVGLSLGAARAVRKQYVSALRENASKWKKIGPRVLALAADLGRAAAASARERDDEVIGAKDWKAATDRFGKLRIPCPLCSASPARSATKSRR